MAKLNYEVLEKSGYDGYILKNAPVKMLQFGEGNFLRAFVDYFFDVSNEKANWNGKVALLQPIAQGLSELINEQDGLYTLYLRGTEKGEKVDRKRVISVVDRCYSPFNNWEEIKDIAKSDDLEYVSSNTTEAGIVYDPESKPDQEPPASFPAKLAVLLHERFLAGKGGLVVLSCELIDNNGKELQKIILKHIDDWGWGEEFSKWISEECLFCSTLVDRIVPGYPKGEAEAICEELGYRDDLLDAGEVFASWIIEGPKSIMDEFPADKAGLAVSVVDNVDAYKKRKVRILNGAHTSMVLAAYLAGRDIVRDCMEDDCIRGYMKKALYDEIIPVLKGLDKKELEDFTEAVFDRFANPFIDHELLSIALNSTAKWKARVMPSLLEYHELKGELPRVLTFSFAAYLSFYHSGRALEEGALKGERDGQGFLIKDDEWVLEEFLRLKDAGFLELTEAITDNEKMWGDSLKKLPGFKEAVRDDLELIADIGMYEAMRRIQA